MSLLQKILYNVFAQAPQLLSALATSIITSRILGPESKGYFVLITNDAALFGMILNLGIPAAMSYYLASKKSSAGKVVALGLGHLLATGGVLGCTLLIASTYGLDLDVVPDKPMAWMVYAFIMSMYMLTTVSALFSSVFIGEKKFRTVNQASVVGAVANLLFFGLFYVLHPALGEQGLSWVMAISALIAAFTAFYWVISYVKIIGHAPEWKSVSGQFKLLLGFSAIGYLSSILNFLNYRLDIWVVDYYNGAEQLGLYSLAVNLTQMMWLISDPIGAVLRAYLSAPEYQSIKTRVMEAYTRLNSTVILTFSFVAFFCAPYLIPLVYSSAFAETVLPFQVLLLGNYFACSSKILSVNNYSDKRMKINLIATAVGLVITIAADFYLIPKYGIAGAAWASNAAYFGLFTFLVVMARRNGEIKSWNQWLLLPRDLNIVRMKLP